MSERTIRRIRFRCGFQNRNGVVCTDDATHEVRNEPRSMGKFCKPHAEEVLRNGADDFGMLPAGLPHNSKGE
jgi:hypothetical protein